MIDKKLKPPNDIVELSHGAPVALCREVEYPRGGEVTNYVWPPKTNFMTLTPRYVVLIHLREALLEFERNPFAHDTHAVDGVDEGLSV